jgi:hypothetical protein
MVLFAWLIDIPLQILWLPLSIIGGLWVAYKQVPRRAFPPAGGEAA